MMMFDDDDDDDDDESMKLVFAHSYSLETVTSVLMKMCSSKQFTGLVDIVVSYGGDTQSRNLRKKLAQVSCLSFLHQIFVQVHVSSCTRNFHNKYPRQNLIEILRQLL